MNVYDDSQPLPWCDFTNRKARKSIITAIEEFRKDEKLTMVKMARALDIPYWTYVKYQNRERTPSKYTAEYLFRRLWKLRYDALHRGILST
jgi:hypothetical protein